MKDMFLKASFILSILVLSIACTKPEKPSFKRLNNIKFNSISLKKPYSVSLNADAVFNNPNAIGAQLSAMDFDVFINGIKATHIKQNISTKVAAQADFSLPIICKIPLQEIFEDLNLSALLRSQEIQYQLRGHLELDLAGTGVKVPIDYKGVERLGL